MLLSSCVPRCGRPRAPPAPAAVKLWMQAARLESTEAAKKRVLLRALERIPQSVRLWKAVVEISDEDDARVLLVSARGCHGACMMVYGVARIEL